MPKIKLSLLVVLVLVLATSLRFYNLFGNFAIDGDSGRDVMIAHEAIRRGEIPLTGPFTSAGPFVFGPFFYWFVTASYLILPFGLLSPWVGLFVASLGFVGVMMAIGKQLGGQKLAIILGLLAASSPQMVARSRALTQHTLVGLTSALVILCFVLLWQKKKVVFATLLGLALGTAVSLHYQALNLLIFLPAVFFVPVDRKTKILSLLLAVGGFLLPLLPLLFWDSRQEFASLRNLVDYFLIGQYRLYVPNSWRLFLFDQFPSYFAFVTGGIFPVGLALFFATLLAALRSRGITLFLAAVYFILLIANRYYHGERFEGYLIYFAPIILLFSAMLITRLGIIALAAILIFNLAAITRALPDNPHSLALINQAVQALPNTKYTIYQNNPNAAPVSYPLYLLLSQKNAIGAGTDLGVVLDTSSTGFHLVDPANAKGEWQKVGQKEVYDDLISWLRSNKLKSSFSLSKYLQERLDFK